MDYIYFIARGSDMKNYILIIIMALNLSFGLFCDQITLERDNPLDPKNSDSKRDRISLVELFVNDNIPNSSFAQNGVVDLFDGDYNNRIVVIEYHIHDSYPDDYSDEVENMQELIDRYDILRNDRVDGLPYIAVNGIYMDERENSIQGASSADSVKNRLGNLLDNEISQSNFTIEGTITKTNPIEFNIQIAKLGKESASDLTINFAVIENIDSDYRFVLRDLIPERQLDTIKSGEIKDVNVSSATITVVDSDKISGVVWIENTEGNVLQSTIIQ